MTKKRFQNKVAESRMALPFTTIYALLVCLSFGLYTERLWVSYALLCISTYLMVELNNTNSLIRVFSRMMSCSFIVLTLLSKSCFADVRCGVIQVCFIAFYLLFFQTYQDKKAVGQTFYAFLMLGIASVFFPQTLFYVPFVWILMFNNMLSGGIRTVCASILGLAVPYWFWSVYCVCTGDVEALISHFTDVAVFGKVFDVAFPSFDKAVPFCFVSLLALVGIVHFHRNKSKDRIRTRMFFEIFTVFNLLTIFFVLLQPVHIKYFYSILIVSTAPMIAHYISLTDTKWTNLSFHIILLASLLITVSNLWMPF